jgi:hypothetical protein
MRKLIVSSVEYDWQKIRFTTVTESFLKSFLSFHGNEKEKKLFNSGKAQVDNTKEGKTGRCPKAVILLYIRRYLGRHRQPAVD